MTKTERFSKAKLRATLLKRMHAIQERERFNFHTGTRQLRPNDVDRAVEYGFYSALEWVATEMGIDDCYPDNYWTPA